MLLNYLIIVMMQFVIRAKFIYYIVSVVEELINKKGWGEVNTTLLYLISGSLIVSVEHNQFSVYITFSLHSINNLI